MIIQYLIRTLRLPVSVGLYVLPVVTPSNFSFFMIRKSLPSLSVFDPEINLRFLAFSSGIASFFSQLPTLSRFRLPFVFFAPFFWDCKGKNLF
jgi:hypothetical protein